MLHSLPLIAVLQAQQASLDMMSCQHVRLCCCTHTSLICITLHPALAPAVLRDIPPLPLGRPPSLGPPKPKLQDKHGIATAACNHKLYNAIIKNQLKCIGSACLVQPLAVLQIKQTPGPPKPVKQTV